LPRDAATRDGRAHDGPGFEDIRAELIRRIDQLVRDLAPGGKSGNGYYMTRNPQRNDKRPGSFWVRVSGSGVGVWKDEATMDKAGDVISFVQHCAGLPDMRATRAWCLSWLSWEKGVDHSKLQMKRKVDGYVQEQDERLAREDLLAKRRKAKGWWLAANPKIEGTLVDTYLAARGIDLLKLAHMPRALRFIPKAQHSDQDGVVTEWPCMIAAMNDVEGNIIAVHRTFLTVDGRNKAPVVPQRKIWPHGYHGAVIRLQKGAGGLSPEEASRRGVTGTLLECESIEDGLSCAIPRPDLRIWAAGTLGNLVHVPVEHPCVSNAILFADNDQGAQAKALLAKAVTTQREKRRVTVARSPSGKDANDLLRGIT
jgi:Toprim domain